MTIDGDRQDILELTASLRGSADPIWSRLRALFVQRGVNPPSSVLVEFFPDDVSFQYGVVVSGDARVYQFGFDYLHRTEAEGVLSEWKDISGSFQSTAFSSNVQIGLSIVQAQHAAR